MAVAFDAASTGGGNAPNTTAITWSHTCTGANLVLLVVVALRSDTATGTTITYNSVALTLVRRLQQGTRGVTLEVWRLIAPATGANTVSVAASANVVTAAAAISYTGVDQTTPVGTEVTNDAASGNPSISSWNGGNANDVAFACATTGLNGAGSTLNVSGAQTQRANKEQDNASVYIRLNCADQTGGASVTSSWTSSDGNAWEAIGVPVKAAAARKASRMLLVGAG